MGMICTLVQYMEPLCNNGRNTDGLDLIQSDRFSSPIRNAGGILTMSCIGRNRIMRGELYAWHLNLDD